MVHVSDRIQSFANVANRQENVFWSKMIQNAIDQFDAQGDKWCSVVVRHLVVGLSLRCCAERNMKWKFYLCSSLFAIVLWIRKKVRLFRKIVQPHVGRNNMGISCKTKWKNKLTLCNHHRHFIFSLSCADKVEKRWGLGWGRVLLLGRKTFIRVTNHLSSRIFIPRSAIITGK